MDSLQLFIPILLIWFHHLSRLIPNADCPLILARATDRSQNVVQHLLTWSCCPAKVFHQHVPTD